MQKIERVTNISQMTLQLEPKMRLTFQAACLRRDTSPSQVMRRLIEEQMVKWGESMELVAEEPQEVRGG